MSVYKLTPQMQQNCIIPLIDFVLAFKMYRYQVASLLKEGSESQNSSIPRKQGKAFQGTREKSQFFKWNSCL